MYYVVNVMYVSVIVFYERDDVCLPVPSLLTLFLLSSQQFSHIIRRHTGRETSLVNITEHRLGLCIFQS